MAGLTPNRTAVAACLVLLTGLAWGAVLWRTYVMPLAPAQRLDFRESEVLTAREFSPRIFFRKTLHLPVRVRSAWAAVAAGENFVFLVNGQEVGKMGYPVAAVQEVYDLTPFLKPGKNVLALEVARATYPEPAWVRFTGGYVTWEGAAHTLKSDRTWRAVPRLENLLRSGPPLAWHAPAYDDRRWPQAAPYAGKDPTRLPTAPSIWPALLTLPPQGPWLWDADPAATVVRLGRTIDSPFPGPRRVWLRLSALCPYRLTVNGETVALRAQTSRSLDLYDLKPVWRRGENRVVVEVVRPPVWRGGLVELFLEDGRGVTFLDGREGWALLHAEGEGEALLRPAVLAPYPSYPGAPLPQQVRALVLPWWHAWWAALSLILAAGGAAFLALGHWRLWEAVWRRSRSDPDLRSRLAFWHLPALLFLAGVYLLSFDLRFHPDLAYQGWVGLTALSLLMAGQFLGGLFHRPGGRADAEV